MVGPFWARATYSQKYPELLHDAQAIGLLETLKAWYRDTHAEAHYELMQKLVDEFVGLDLLFRARSFDDAIRKYIGAHPRATVVNIGCGLDTAFTRVDNGQILWHDLDLPEAIAIRQRLIPEAADAPRCKVISKSVFDQIWFDAVEFSRENGAFFIMGGLLYYFTEAEVVPLLRAMASRFPGGELIFDMASKFGLKIWNRRLQKSGTRGADFKLSIDNAADQIARWDPALQVIDEFPLFSRLPHDPRWKRKTRLMMALADWLKAMQVIQLRFPERR